MSGTLAGRPWDMDPGAPPRDIDRFVGIARNAKLAFFDVSVQPPFGDRRAPLTSYRSLIAISATNC